MNTAGLEFWLTCKYIISEFLDKIPIKILRDVLFHVFGFLIKVSFNALTSSFTTFYMILKLGTEMYRRLSRQF